MKSIKKIVLSLFAIFLTTLCLNVNAKIKEDPTLFNGDVYIIGSTKFDGEYIITASRAATAGADEAFIQYNVYNNYEYRGTNIKTYYYCATDQTWSEIIENGSGLRELTTAETNKLKDALNIYFINNVEKKLEIPFNGNIDENSIMGGIDGTATFENGIITIPAYWINGFSFESDGNEISVTLATTDEEGNITENESPVIKTMAKLTANFPSNLYVGSDIEFEVTLTPNDYADEELSSYFTLFYTGINGFGEASPYDNLSYYDEATSTWKSDLYNIFGNFVTAKTIKFKFHPNFTGEYYYSVSANIAFDGYTNVTGYLDVTVDPSMVAVVDRVNYFDDLKTAIASDGSTVKLLKDININEEINVDKDIILDLGNNTINLATGSRFVIGSDANVTAENGIVSGKNVAFKVKDNATFTVNDDLTINLTDDTITIDKWGITVFNSATLNFSGIINVSKDGHGISGNGSQITSTTVNILGGTINVPDGAAIYQPQISTLNISGGSLIANTVIGIKSGSLFISGGSLTATGKKAAPVTDNDGFEYTGDVIFIEENNKYQDNITIDISAGTLTSTNGYIIQEYNPTLGNETELTATITGLYSVKNTTDNAKIFYYTAE